MSDPLLEALQNDPRAEAKRRSDSKEAEMLILWDSGLDTVDIARCLEVPESYVANTLPKLRERRRNA